MVQFFQDLTYGKMKFILHSSKKFFTFKSLWRIINRSRVNISNFLINSPFAGTNIFNLFVKLFKISGAETRPVFHSVHIQGIALVNIVFQNSSSPLSKLCASLGIYPITNGNNGFKTIKSDLS